jgi:type II secretory pathway pseudopilin PulG
MLSTMHTMARERPPGEAGFTLLELCVAMAAAVVVVIGLTSIMISTLQQTQRTFSKVDATRQARTALANLENELHSACVGGEAPIQGAGTNGVTGSDADNLVFLSFFGTSANPTPVWHQVSFDSAAGTVTDDSYNVTGTSPGWARAGLVSTTTLLANVTRQSSGTPVFQYYAYQPEYTDAGGNVYWSVPDGTDEVPFTGATPDDPLPASSGLSQVAAATVVEVAINLLVGPSSSTSNDSSLSGVDDPVTDAISLRLTTPPNEVAAGATAQGFGPCQ